MKDYYKILGLEEGASLEEITARWLEIKKEYQCKAEKHNGTDNRIKEINEAYRVLKASVPPAYEFDPREYLKRRALARKARENAAKKKMIIFSSSVLAICLIIGAFLFTLPRLPTVVQLASTFLADPNRITRGSIEETAALPLAESTTPVMISRVAPPEPGKTEASEGTPPVSASQESPAAVINDSREANVREKPTTPPAGKPDSSVKVAKVAPQEPSRRAIDEGTRSGPISKGSPAISIPPPTAPAIKPEASAEVARVARQEPRKTAIAESTPPGPVSKESPPVSIPSPTAAALKTASLLDAAKAVPEEPRKTAIAEGVPPGPVSKESPAVSIPQPTPSALKTTPTVEEAKRIPQEKSKINVPEKPKIASIPSPPSSLASEREIWQFFESYVNRYNSKSIEGFISFFSPKAVQNQKENFERIRKIYDHFFDQMETVQYQIAINKIETRQNSIEVKAEYQLDGTLSKGRKKQNWRGEVRWVLVRENGALKIVSLDYQPQK